MSTSRFLKTLAVSSRFLTTLVMSSSSSSSSSWSCNKCTFLNSPSQKLKCVICLTPVSNPFSSPPLSLSSNDEPKWACKACTFLNTYKNSVCDVCGTRSPTSSLLGFDDLTDSGIQSNNPDCSVGSVFFPLRRCSKRKAMDDDVIEVGGGSAARSESLDFMKNNKETERKGRVFCAPYGD